LCATLGKGALLLYGVVVVVGVVFLVVSLASHCARVYLLVHGWTCLDEISLRKVGWVFPNLGFFQDKFLCLLVLVTVALIFNT
jgi:hypothetical protein